MSYSARTERAREKGQRAADEFNAAFPEGTPVWLTNDIGERIATKTRSVAWILGDGAPVVLVEGKTGGWMLERIERRDEA